MTEKNERNVFYVVYKVFVFFRVIIYKLVKGEKYIVKASYKGVGYPFKTL